MIDKKIHYTGTLFNFSGHYLIFFLFRTLFNTNGILGKEKNMLAFYFSTLKIQIICSIIKFLKVDRFLYIKHIKKY